MLSDIHVQPPPIKLLNQHELDTSHFHMQLQERIQFSGQIDDQHLEIQSI